LSTSKERGPPNLWRTTSSRFAKIRNSIRCQNGHKVRSKQKARRSPNGGLSAASGAYVLQPKSMGKSDEKVARSTRQVTSTDLPDSMPWQPRIRRIKKSGARRYGNKALGAALGNAAHGRSPDQKHLPPRTLLPPRCQTRQTTSHRRDRPAILAIWHMLKTTWTPRTRTRLLHPVRARTAAPDHQRSQRTGLTARFDPIRWPHTQPEPTHHPFSSQSTRELALRGNDS
jgi:hypothetical protein